MAWSNPSSRSTGDLVTAAIWNQDVSDNVQFLYDNLRMPYVHLREEQAQNTHGGTFTSGAWRTRVLNTEVTDTDNICTLAANQFTLPAGTYVIHATAPAYKVDSHKAQLQNITDASTTIVGTTEQTASGDGVTTVSFVRGLFTIAAQKTFELQHACTNTVANEGFGRRSNLAVEVYSEVEIWRLDY